MNAVQSLAWPRADRSIAPADRLARGLGWFSLALGAAQLAAPGRLARALGLEGRERLVRAYGVREIGSGVAALSINPGPAMWGRVAGDAIDLATLAVGARRSEPERRRGIWIAAAAVAGVAALDLLTAAALSAAKRRPGDDWRDYSDRSGFPRGAGQARGARKRQGAPMKVEAATSEPAGTGTAPIFAA